MRQLHFGCWQHLTLAMLLREGMECSIHCVATHTLQIMRSSSARVGCSLCTSQQYNHTYIYTSVICVLICITGRNISISRYFLNCLYWIFTCMHFKCANICVFCSIFASLYQLLSFIPTTFVPFYPQRLLEFFRFFFCPNFCAVNSLARICPSGLPWHKYVRTRKLACHGIHTCSFLSNQRCFRGEKRELVGKNTQKNYAENWNQKHEKFVNNFMRAKKAVWKVANIKKFACLWAMPLCEKIMHIYICMYIL